MFGQRQRVEQVLLPFGHQAGDAQASSPAPQFGRMVALARIGPSDVICVNQMIKTCFYAVFDLGVSQGVMQAGMACIAAVMLAGPVLQLWRRWEDDLLWPGRRGRLETHISGM